MDLLWKKDLVWYVERSVKIFVVRVKLQDSLHKVFLTHGFSWCRYTVTTLHSCDDHLQVEQLQQKRINTGTLSYICHVRNESLLLKRTAKAFLPSPGSVVFIASIVMLNARPTFHRTSQVQDLSENETTDFAYQNLGWMRCCYNTEAFRIHPTKTGNAVCFTLRLAILVSM